MDVPAYDEYDPQQFAPLLKRMSKDMKQAAITLSSQEARFLVDTYYQMQKDRLVSASRVRAMPNEPHLLMSWLREQNHFLEKQIAVSLDVFSANNVVGQWMRSIVGIGPIISAGILAHIDIVKAPVVANIWTFAGLDPKVKWEKGKLRPWNAKLKTLCYKAGECFVYTQNKPDDYYGKLYKKRKQYEIERNEAGMYAEQAKTIIEAKRFDKSTIAYKAYAEGKLPAAHIHARARRYAVKFWLSHVHYVWYTNEYSKEPEMPFKNFAPPPGSLPDNTLRVLMKTTSNLLSPTRGVPLK